MGKAGNALEVGRHGPEDRGGDIARAGHDAPGSDAVNWIVTSGKRASGSALARPLNTVQPARGGPSVPDPQAIGASRIRRHVE